jgi:hypothetical protein
MMEKGGFSKESRLFVYRRSRVQKSKRGSGRMKQWVLLLMVTIVLSGCGQLARESEFWDHSSMYKDWGHLSFSMVGYKDCNAENAIKSKRDGWWGITMPCGAIETAAPIVERQKPKEQPKGEAIVPEKKADKEAVKKETPVEKKKVKKKKKKAKSKRKETTNQ